MTNPYRPPHDAPPPPPTGEPPVAAPSDDGGDQPGWRFYIVASLLVWAIILGTMVVLVLILAWLASL